MAVITVSKDFASGGRELGRLVAKKLGYHYVALDLEGYRMGSLNDELES